MTGECKATAGMMGRFILQLAGRQAGHGPTSSRSQAREREHILSDMGAASVLAAVDTNVTAVTQVTASPLLPQDLHSASPLRQGENAARWVPQRSMLTSCLLQGAPLGMALAPKYYFCMVSQHCSSCLTLRLLFLLTVF